MTEVTLGPSAIYAAVASTAVVVAYLYGKYHGRYTERCQIRDWLRFLHHEINRTTLLSLAASIFAGQHWDWDGEDE